MAFDGSTAGRLVIVCGLPGAGKTTTATRIAAERDGVRLNADEEMERLGLDLWDGAARARVEADQWLAVQDLLRDDRTVIVEWGSWTRTERDRLRDTARSLGALAELVYLDEPDTELLRRIQARSRDGLAITAEDLAAWREAFDVPSATELALYDQWLDLDSPRPTVRVICLDSPNRVLMMLWRDPTTNELIWEPPGGGIEPGESPRAAAVRELAEETGIRDARLQDRAVILWRDFDWDGRRWAGDEVFLLAHTTETTLEHAGLQDNERDHFVEHRWVELDEIDRLPERVDPPNLRQVIEALTEQTN